MGFVCQCRGSLLYESKCRPLGVERTGFRMLLIDLMRTQVFWVLTETSDRLFHLWGPAPSGCLSLLFPQVAGIVNVFKESQSFGNKILARDLKITTSHSSQDLFGYFGQWDAIEKSVWPTSKFSMLMFCCCCCFFWRVWNLAPNFPWLITETHKLLQGL